jgi:hypothetical protein
MIEFVRQAPTRSEVEGGRKPVTFDFLEFTHICKRIRRVKFGIHLRPSRSSLLGVS